MRDPVDSFEQAVREEGARQDAKWGDQRNLSSALWMTILGEEKGECDRASLEQRPDEMLTELIHVAAVAKATYMSILQYGMWR